MSGVRVIEEKYLPKRTREEKLFIFGEGEWIDEEDFHQFVHNGVECRVLRNTLGSLCGYVSLANGHPWRSIDIFEDSQDEIDVHGGLTFSEAFDDGEHWIGFDCSHARDITPSCEITLKQVRADMRTKFPDLCKRGDQILSGNFMGATYKNMNYVIEECKSLADQAIKAAHVK